MMIPALPTPQKFDHSIFEDLDDQEKLLMKECMAKIITHVDKNIEGAHEPSTVARFLTIRWVINKNI